MNAVICGDLDEFFAPASADMVDGLIGQYQQARNRIEQVAKTMSGEMGGVVHYFIDGNKSGRDAWYGVDRLFERDGAVAALNADFWNRALGLTDVLDLMPQKRRDEWFEQIREKKCPDFEEDTVRHTLADLLAMRGKFFAERVDGLFRSLSGAHVTNRPEGFGKRMIIAGVLSSHGNYPDSSRSGTINDLRCVIAKFMGRDEPSYGATDAVIRAATRNPGEWMDVDGGALRIRVYVGVGTAHLEVHPDMAWRLNAVLASLYPAAIPSRFRTQPKRKPKEVALMQRPLPFVVVEILAGLKPATERYEVRFQTYHRDIPRTLALNYSSHDKGKAARQEAVRVLEAIGGVPDKIGGYEFFRFDYEPQAVLDEIVCSGCIPDHKSHQFYPTPEGLARQAVELAEIGPAHRCLEPSAGIGGLADFMPLDNTLCVEVSALHSAILEAKGFRVVQGDFLEYAPVSKPVFDRIVMNPPFDQGRWLAHLDAAAGVLAPGGRLVAILPAGAKSRDVLPGWSCVWHGPFDNQFAGASVSVVILVASKGDA